MFCQKCGHEVAEGARFCAVCGEEIHNKGEQYVGEQSANADASVDSKKPNSSNAQNINTGEQKQSVIRKILSPKIYYPAMVILVLVAVIMGRMQNSTKDEVVDLAQFVGAPEETVMEFFGVEQNELGMYPDDSDATVVCQDGKVATINISESTDEYEKYSFCGVQLYDEVDSAREKLQSNKYELVSEAEMGQDSICILTDENHFTLSLVYNKEKKVTQIMYSTEIVDDMADTSDDIAETDEESIGDVLVDGDSNVRIEDALAYAGKYESEDGYVIILDAFTSVETDAVGVVTVYYNGELMKEETLYICYDPGDWEGWNYDALYAIHLEGYDEYLGFYTESNGRIMLDYNGPTKNYTMLEMTEHYES